MKKIADFLQQYAEDFFIVAGAVFINVATFKIHTIAGMYCIGVTFLALGVAIARYPPKRR